MNMNEFGITKIMDGIFISDLSLLQDYQFLIGNKVSHIVVWTDASNKIYLDSQDSKILNLPRYGSDGLLPSANQLVNVYDFIEESKEQFLCCLICSDFQSEAAMVLSAYLIKKYLWDLQTAFRYVGLRFNDFSPRVQIVQQLQDFQINLQILQPTKQLKTVEFTYEFLQSYQTDDYQQRFILNTIKNTTLDKIIFFQKKKNIPKRRKRLQWFDRIRPSSSISAFTCKFTVFNRNLSLKPKGKFPQNDLPKQSIQALSQSLKPQKMDKKNSQVVNVGQFFMDGLQFESLKQLTRCKITQSRMKGSIRKTASLRVTNFKTYLNLATQLTQHLGEEKTHRA